MSDKEIEQARQAAHRLLTCIHRIDVIKRISAERVLDFRDMILESFTTYWLDEDRFLGSVLRPLLPQIALARELTPSRGFVTWGSGVMGSATEGLVITVDAIEGAFRRHYAADLIDLAESQFAKEMPSKVFDRGRQIGQVVQSLVHHHRDRIVELADGRTMSFGHFNCVGLGSTASQGYIALSESETFQEAVQVLLGKENFFGLIYLLLNALDFNESLASKEIDRDYLLVERAMKSGILSLSSLSGEVVTPRVLKSATPLTNPPKRPGDEVTDGKGGKQPLAPQYVTLDQLAAMVRRSKRTLENWRRRQKNPMPDPDVEGGGGKPHEWIWEKIRLWLEHETCRTLPVDFPSIRP